MKLFFLTTKYITILTLFFIFSACSRDEVEAKIKYPFLSCEQGTTNNLDTVRTFVKERYDWAYTHLSYRNGEEYSNPQTEDKEISYFFKANNEFEIHENGVLIESYLYEIGNYYDLMPGFYPDTISIITLKDKETMVRQNYYELYVCNDSLFLSKSGSYSLTMHFSKNNL